MFQEVGPKPEHTGSRTLPGVSIFIRGLDKPANGGRGLVTAKDCRTASIVVGNASVNDVERAIREALFGR